MNPHLEIAVMVLPRVRALFLLLRELLTTPSDKGFLYTSRE